MSHRTPFLVTLIAALAASTLALTVESPRSFAQDPSTPPLENPLIERAPDEPGQNPGQNPGDNPGDSPGENHSETPSAPGETGPPRTAGAPAKPASPLDLIMKNGIPASAEQRAVLREDLYALLATAATAKEAVSIARQIERVWITSGSDTVTVLLGRATRALKSKDNALALTLLDAVVDLAPDNAEAWNRRAFLHYATKNYNAAVGDLRRALALDKNHYKALDGLASIFQQMGDDAKALAVYEQLRQIYPFWPGLDKAYETLKGKVQGRGI